MNDLNTTTYATGFTVTLEPGHDGPYGVPASAVVRRHGLAVGRVARWSDGTFSPAPYVVTPTLQESVDYVIREYREGISRLA